MTRNLLRAGALSCALLTSTALSTSPALAQLAREHRSLDANGVDLTHGDFVMAVTEGSIGSGDAELPLVRTGAWINGNNGHQWDNIGFRRETLSGGGEAYVVTVGTKWERFSTTGTLPSGSTLSGSGNSFIYRRPDGTTIEFSDDGNGGWGSDSNFCTGDPNQGTCDLLPTVITSPDGKTVNLNWDVRQYCWDIITAESMPCTFDARLGSVSNSFGYEIRFTYATSIPGTGGTVPAWFQRTGATFHNTTVTGSPAEGNVSYNYPSTGVTEVTDMGGREWRIAGTGNRVTAIRRPGASSDTTTIGYASNGSVNSVTRDGAVTSYTRTVAGSTATMTVTQVDGNSSTADPQTVVVSDLTIGRPTSVTNALSQTTEYAYDSSRRLTRITAPEDNYVEYTYDGRGNVTRTEFVSKSGQDVIATSASFDSTCSNPVTCNRPNSVTDANGNTTTFTYDQTHGGVLTATGPEPTSGATRPQTRYKYTLTNGEYRLTEISACATMAGASGTTQAACLDTADESRTILGYDANGNVNSVTRRSGNTSGTGAVSTTTTAIYTPRGDVASIDGPLTGSADTVRYRYNSARQLVGVISADPDGPASGTTGLLPHRAVRMTYNSTSGLPIRQEVGTVPGITDTDWAAFDSAQGREVEYDQQFRPRVERLLSDTGATYSLSQTSYDALGRVRCVAQRMNMSEYASSSLPSDNCTVDTEGTYGPDRIVRLSYDALGRANQLEAGVGTSAAAVEASSTFTANGQLATLRDGQDNLTTYVYDDHDRLLQTRYPVAAQGANSSSVSDYEQLTYDDAGNITNVRLRDAQNIAFSYDALNRVTLKNLPGSEPDVSYTYDLLGRLTGASRTGHALSFTYDALGRQLTQTGPEGTLASQFDDAGRRTRLEYPGSPAFHVTYDYLITGEMSRMRENGTTDLATFTYDELGRRDLLTLGNGAQTDYGYNAEGRLASLEHRLQGVSADQVLSFDYNPAGQIVSNIRSNDVYSFTEHTNGSRTDTHNGRNQIATSGGSTVVHDARGNLTSDGTRTFNYSSENLLTSQSGVNGTLQYDPAMRLVRTAPGMRLAYDGTALVEEHNGGGRVARYVHGPSMDEPLVWYDQAGTRRFLQADERGSVTAISGASALAYQANEYDEYGRGSSNNLGRFGYTGQARLPEHGLLFYKARMYDPALGRFLQSDPISYAGGMNVYTYVNGDPINRTDPFGLHDCVPGEDCVTVTGTPMRRGRCAEGQFQINDGCVSRDYVISATSGRGTITVITSGRPVISPGVNCTSNGNSVTCPVEEEDEDQASCGTGERVVIPFGIGATGFLFFGGFSLTAEAGLSVPLSAFQGDFRGLQVYGSGSAVGLLGGGLFIGAGTYNGLGRTSGPILNGSTTSLVVQGGAAVKAGGEFQADLGPANSPSLASVTGGGGPRVGYGGYLAGGVRRTYTVASPELCY